MGACYGAVSTGIALERALEEVVAMADIALGTVQMARARNGGGQVPKNTDGAGSKEDSGFKKNRIPNDDSITGHIFRDAEGHIPDTPENRALLEDVANDSANFRGTDKYGNKWYTRTQSDGSLVWVEIRNGKIFEGGVNVTPKQWNPETGLKKPW